MLEVQLAGLFIFSFLINLKPILFSQLEPIKLNQKKKKKHASREIHFSFNMRFVVEKLFAVSFSRSILYGVLEKFF